jgi:hypothetical protein
MEGGFFTLVSTFFKLFFIHVLWIRNFVVCLHHRNDAVPNKHHKIMFTTNYNTQSPQFEKFNAKLRKVFSTMRALGYKTSMNAYHMDSEKFDSLDLVMSGDNSRNFLHDYESGIKFHYVSIQMKNPNTPYSVPSHKSINNMLQILDALNIEYTTGSDYEMWYLSPTKQDAIFTSYHVTRKHINRADKETLLSNDLLEKLWDYKNELNNEMGSDVKRKLTSEVVYS